MDVAYASARDRLGQTLGGKYHLHEVLGVGGTAVVYRAAAPDGGFVALKLLHDWLSRSEEVSRRFMREGYVGNVLDHRGTVRVLDAGNDDDGSAYLVLELLEGESLEERRVRLGGRLPINEALDYTDQLLAVLEIAHAKGIVHRDIKPSNLFLMKDGTIKVLDFGIARLVNDTAATSTKTGQMIGTPAFMPPEQALSRPSDVDARTDIWSVGATLFTLISGELVHVAQSSSEHLVKAATLHARSLAKAYRGIPANIESVVARALAFDKSERWQSAAEMRAEIARVRLDPGKRIGTSTSPPPERDATTSHVTTMIVQRESAPPSDRTSDPRMSFAGANPSQARPRRMILALAVGTSLLLLLTSVVVLFFAVRTTRASHAAEAQSQAGEARSAAPPPAAEPSVSLTPPAAPAPPQPPAASASPSQTSQAHTAPKSPPRSSEAKSPPPPRKPKVDIYRPF